MRRIITVGREFGSGGRELGRRSAEELQIAYYDQEIITEIAKRTALSEAYIRQIEENLSEAQMKKRIMEIDRSRAQYYTFFTEQKWGAKENFDLLANTSGTDIKKMSESLCCYIRAYY